MGFRDADGVWHPHKDAPDGEVIRVGYTWTGEVVRIADEKDPARLWWESRINGKAVGRTSNKDHAKAHIDWHIAYEIQHMHDGYVQIAARKECWEGFRSSTKPMKPYVR
ncbi:MAG TPA: hypothetical protein VGG10_12750 [Rhizomicrobium sp.]|jgi:hypothetical protein